MLSGCGEIRKYTNKLKDLHITEWDKEERYYGIALFAYLTIQMQNLTRIFPVPSFSLEHLPLSLSIDLQSLLDIKEAGFIGRFERPETSTVQGQVYLRGGFCVGKGA